MPHGVSPRLERVLTLVGAGFGLGGILLFWVFVRLVPRPLAAILLGGYFLGWGAFLLLCRPPRRRAIARFTVTTLALLVSLGALELLSAVGLVDFRDVLATGGPDPRNHPDNTRDPELIHIHKPHLKRAGATRGDIALALHLPGTPLHPYDVAFDRNGFRNPPELSEARVVVLGDSFVEGGLVATENLLTATLGHLLRCPVANLGQSGYGPQQELAVLKRHAASMHPRLCVWTFYEGNDLEDVERYEQMTAAGGPSAVRSTPWERSFGRNALLALSGGVGHFLAQERADQAPCGVFQDENRQRTRLFFVDRRDREPCRERDALNQVVSILDAARGVCATNGTSMLIVFAPEKFRVYKDFCTYRPDNPCSGWVLDDLPERLRTRVAALGPGIGFLDLTPALVAEAAQGRILYFADDTHWTAAGHRVAGEAIAAYVAVSRGLEDPPDARRAGRDRFAVKAGDSRRR